jgi:CRISPR system Cascade subunit CasA
MNVAFDPWIPVITISGERVLASLCDVFTEGEKFADLAVRPHERVSLMRFFLCVAHASLNGPKDDDEWCDAPKMLSETVQTYLTVWRDSFELFHAEKPWLQVAELKGVEKETGESGKTSPVALLDFELATGNTSTLNDHGGQMNIRMIEPERVALTLLTFQNFSPGGGLPVAQWKSTRTSQVGNPDAPCLSQSMAHCLLRAKSLAETIHLNLPTFESIARDYKTYSTDKISGNSYSNVALGKPIWEFFPKSPDKESDRAINATQTYMGRLVPVSRWIRLIHGSDQMYCCNGFKYKTYKDGFASEPTAAVRLITKKDKKGVKTTERKIVKIEPSRALWRELSSLLVKRSADGIGGPLAMINAPCDTEFDFHVCALIRDQASMDIAVESVFHISPAFLINITAYQVEIAGGEKILGADGYARKLRWAVENYRQLIDIDWEKRVERTQAKERNSLKDRLAQSALLSYWTTVEKNLSLLMNHIEAIGTVAALPTREAWRKMLLSAACEAYQTACGQETPRQLQAFVKGWQMLIATRVKPEEDKI